MLHTLHRSPWHSALESVALPDVRIYPKKSMP